MDQVQDLWKEYTNLDTYMGFVKEAVATGLFLYTAQANGGAAPANDPIRWGLTYIIFSSITDCQMLSTLRIRDFAKKGEYSFKAFQSLFNSLFAQALGAFFGHLLFNYTESSELAAVGNNYNFSIDNNWQNMVQQFFMVFVFIFFTTKNADQNKFWSFVAVAAAFWVFPNCIFTPNRAFGAGFNMAGFELTDIKSWFGWFEMSWAAYALTFVAAYLSHFFTEYLF